MEDNNHQQTFSQLCKLGCGYFGSANFDGLCSQCFKDKQQQCGDSDTLNNTTFTTYKSEPFDEVKELVTEKGINTEAVILTAKDSSNEYSTSASCSLATDDINKINISNSDTTGSISPSVTKNRCQICRKKLGLTGFGCRCGGRFCCLHRYSDSHSCTFDYKVDAENAIRKANPRIVSNKVSKI